MSAEPLAGPHGSEQAEPTDPEPLLTVVVPTLGRQTLARQLECLATCRWEHRWEVVVADNGGRMDPSAAAAVGSGLTTVRVVDASRRPGRSFAVNEGARAARGRWLAFCDDDDEVVPSFVERIGNAFLQGAEVVVFNSDVRALNDADVWRAYNHEELEDRRPAFRGIPAFWGCGAVERETFLRLGGFDERFSYAEDLAFSITLHRAGIVPVWIPEQLIKYRLRDSPRDRFSQAAALTVSMGALGELHPDLVAPMRGNRWLQLAANLGRASRLAWTIRTRTGRLELAHHVGRSWGRFKAMGVTP